MRKVFYLRTRLQDTDPWGHPQIYRSRAGRDEDAAQMRILAGIRTWSYEERVTHMVYDEIEFVD